MNIRDKVFEVRERKIEKDVCAFAHKLGIPNIKLDISCGGYPDRLFLIPGGRPLFIEFKSPSGKMTVRQSAIYEALKTLGYNVKICRNVDEASREIKEALDTAQVSRRSV